MGEAGKGGKGGKGGGERVVQLTDKVVGGMGVGKVFKDSQGKINSLDFHRVEDLMVAAGDDDSMHVYDISVRLGPSPRAKSPPPRPRVQSPGLTPPPLPRRGSRSSTCTARSTGWGACGSRTTPTR